MIREQLKRLAKGTLIYGLGTMLNRFLSFLLVPVFTHYLRPEDYGVMAMLGILTLALTGLFSLGTGNSMGVCYFETNDKDMRRNIVWTTSVLLLANSLILLIAGFWLAPQVSMLLLQSGDYTYLVSLSLAGLAIRTITIPFHSYLRMEEKAKTFVIISVISTLLTLGLNVVAVVYLGRGVKGMLEANLVVGGIMSVATIMTVQSSLSFGLSLRWIAPLIKIGYPSIFGLGAFFLIDWADRVMIQRLVSIEELGVYSLGYSFGLAIALLAEGAFGSAWPPYFMSFINKKDEARTLFGMIFKYFLFAYGMLALIFFLAARPIVFLMTTEPFHSAYTVVGLVACAYILKVCYLIMLPGLYYEKQLHIQTIIEWLAAIVNVSLNFLLIPLLQKEGAAIATVLSYVSLTVLVYFIGNKFLQVKYDWKNIGKFVVAFSVAAAIFSIQLTESIWLNVGLNGSLFIVFCGLVYIFMLTSNERSVAINLVTRVRPRFFT